MGKYSNRLVAVAGKEEELTGDIILGNITSYTWSMLIRKSKIQAPYLFETIHLEDKIFLLKLIHNIDSIYFLDQCLYHYFVNEQGLMHKYKYDHYMKKNMEVNRRIAQIIDQFYGGNKILKIKNNALTSYGTERNLFHIYRTSNKENTIAQYKMIQEDWKAVWEDFDVDLLRSAYCKDASETLLLLWKNEAYDDIFKMYDKEIIKYNIKEKLRKVKAWIKR